MIVSRGRKYTASLGNYESIVTEVTVQSEVGDDMPLGDVRVLFDGMLDHLLRGDIAFIKANTVNKDSFLYEEEIA